MWETLVRAILILLSVGAWASPSHVRSHQTGLQAKKSNKWLLALCRFQQEIAIVYILYSSLFFLFESSILLY